MKTLHKLFIAIALLFGMNAFAAPPSFNGTHYQGFVFVGPSVDYMYGTFNVRLNPQAGHEKSYINSSHTVNSSVYFSGYDAVDNRFFSCFVPTGAPIYNQAVDIANNGGDSTYYYITRDTTNNNCRTIYMLRASYYTH